MIFEISLPDGGAVVDALPPRVADFVLQFRGSGDTGQLSTTLIARRRYTDFDDVASKRRGFTPQENVQMRPTAEHGRR